MVFPKAFFDVFDPFTRNMGIASRNILHFSYILQHIRIGKMNFSSGNIQ